MKKGLVWLLMIGVLVGTVLVGWELVAKPGPLRRVWWAYKFKKNPMYEARVELALRRPISEEELALENQLLDSASLLMPLVKELGLVGVWGVPDETAAMVRLAQASNLRRGVDETKLHIYVAGTDQELIGKIINPLAKGYVEAKQEQALKAGDL